MVPEWLHIVFRAFVSIVYLFLLTKLIGKRQLSQMTFFEYTVGITIGSIAAIIAEELDGPIYHGLLSMAVYALFPILLGWLAMKSKRIRYFVEGKPRMLVEEGKILEENLKKERMTVDELLEHLRLHNAFQLQNVEFALLETNGQVSVMQKKKDQMSGTRSFIKTVISDGEILDETLERIGRNREWLIGQLSRFQIDPSEVFYCQIDHRGDLIYDLYKDVFDTDPLPSERNFHPTD